MVSPTHVAAHQTSHESQTRSYDEKDNSAKLRALNRSLFPHVKKLTLIEIANIKESIKQQQQPQPQMELPTLACTSTTSHPIINQQSQEDSVVKRRPSLSLKRKQKEHRKRKQRSSTQMLSPMKKANLSGDRQKLVTLSPHKEKTSVELTGTNDKENTSRYHKLQFAEGTSQQQQHPEPSGDHHCYNDALVNMGYLSPSISTHDDSPETFMLQSPFKSASPTQLSPIPSCRSPHLDTSFYLELRSSSSSPPWSSSPCSARSQSPSPSPTSAAFQESLQICHQQQLHKKSAASSTGSCDVVLASSSDGSCAATPTDNDAISYISDSPKSKLQSTDSDAIISVHTSDHDTCLITPAVAPPTSGELMDSLQEYGLPDIVYQQPFCSVPTEVPSVK